MLEVIREIHPELNLLGRQDGPPVCPGDQLRVDVTVESSDGVNAPPWRNALDARGHQRDRSRTQPPRETV